MVTLDRDSETKPNETGDILRIIDAAIDETAEWLQKWHRSIICNEAPDQLVVSEYSQFLTRFGSWMDLNRDRGLLDQSAFRSLGKSYEEMHEFGRFLAQKAVQASEIPTAEYDAFTEKIQRFNVQARRIREAFRMAVSELDPLTGVQNRQIMMEVLDRERERSLRTNTPCCVVLADIDHFKSVNDNHGHPAGDHVLRTVAGRFLSTLRPYDEIFRYGGEEFLIICPETGLEGAGTLAEHLRVAVAAHEFPIAGKKTASFGVTEMRPGDDEDEMVRRADDALYRAKQSGRNRVELSKETEPDEIV